MSRWKMWVAGWVKRPFLQRFMVWAVHLIVPKQRIGIRLVLFDEHDRVLLLRHLFHPTAPWGLPGGWLEKNESPAACALRELKEETGLTAVIGPPIQTSYEPDGPAHIGIAHLGWTTTHAIKLSNEILEAQWVELNNLPQMFAFTHRAIEKGYQLHQLLEEQLGKSHNE